jgi:hypothetical protein
MRTPFITRLLCSLVFIVSLAKYTLVQAEPSKSLSQGNALDNKTGTNTSVKHNFSGWSTAFKDFQKDLLKEVFEVTKNDYGSYELHFVDQKMTTNRAIQIAESGDTHSGFSTSWGSIENEETNNSLYAYPYVNTLLGLRQCVIHKNNAQKFTSIKNIEDLRKLKIGLGSGWPEMSIYAEHNIKSISAENYNNLFPMLARNRFDLLPLSVLEIEQALDEKHKAHPELEILKTLYIFYPTQLKINVSKKHPHIDRRISIGLSKIFSSDTHKNIFQKHFNIDEARIKNSNIIYLENPKLSKQENKEITDYFKQAYIY